MTSPASLWRPSCSTDALFARAELLAYLRAFFSERRVLEVETPVLARHGVTDRNIEGVGAAWPEPGGGGCQGWLQTSPEYHMKRLLAAGAGSLYQVFRAFRSNERGSRHNPEFSLLEWYRTGFDHLALMDEVADLVCGYLGCKRPVVISYRDLFLEYLGLDPFLCSAEDLVATARKHAGLGGTLTRDQALDALVSLVIEPQLRESDPVFVVEFPASQAALARVDIVGGVAVAHRFELYVQGLELCNGYWELTDSQEQQERFRADNVQRRQEGLDERQPDPYLLDALVAGLPPCAGVALGLDRLLMLRQGADTLDQVVAFPIERA